MAKKTAVVEQPWSQHGKSVEECCVLIKNNNKNQIILWFILMYKLPFDIMQKNSKQQQSYCKQ